MSALVAISTAFVGISIYAQTDDSNMTTFEEEAAKPTEEGTAMDNTTSTASSNGAQDGNTSIADVQSLFDGVFVCDVGTVEISGQTEVASVDNASLTTPTVSVEVMTQTQVAELAANETQTASANNETSIASANCLEMSLNNGTSTSSTNATDVANTTSTSSSNSTLAHRSNATSLSSSNQTSTASAPESGGQILVIEGQDFVPGQAVLIFSEKALLAIDDVDSDGSIHAKVPMPKGGGTTIAGNDTASTSTELRFVETGTQRTATFAFDGQKLTAAASGEIAVKGAGLGGNAGTTTAAAPSANTTSTNNTGSGYTLQ